MSWLERRLAKTNPYAAVPSTREQNKQAKKAAKEARAAAQRRAGHRAGLRSGKDRPSYPWV